MLSWRLFFIFFLGLLGLATHPAAAQINLTGGIQQQSPNGYLVQVNGAYVCISSNPLGCFFDWGDGTTSEDFFPTLHRYAVPGTYTVTLRGYNDRGQTAVSTFQVRVSGAESGEIARVELSNNTLGMAPGSGKGGR